MHYNYKLDEQAITNIIKRHIKPIEKQKQIKPIIYFTRFKTLNLIVKNNTNSAKIHLNQTNVVYKFICPFWECLPKNKNNSYIGYTTTTLSHCVTYHLSENSDIKHLIIKYNNNSNQLTSFDVRKILIDNTIIIIIMLCRQHGYPWPSLATSLYPSSPPAGLQVYILCPHIVAVCKFELVILLLHGHMWGSIGVHHLWGRSCFSSSVPCVWFI